MPKETGITKFTIEAIQNQNLADFNSVNQFVLTNTGQETTVKSVRFWRDRIAEWNGTKPSPNFDGWLAGNDRKSCIAEIKKHNPGKKDSYYKSQAQRFDRLEAMIGPHPKKATIANMKSSITSSQKTKRQAKQPIYSEQLIWNTQIKGNIKEVLFERQYGYCMGECGKQFNDPAAMQIDHNLSDKTKGGTNHFHNLQLMCQGCNSKKGDLTLFEWLGPDHISKMDDLIFKARIKKEGWVSSADHDKISGQLTREMLKNSAD